MSSKAEKEHLMRLQGMEYALEIAKKSGVDGLEAEVRRRSKKYVPLSISKEELMEFSEKVKENTLQNAVLLFMVTLRDELGFGEKRISQVVARFWKKAECLAEDYTTWDDMTEILADEVGIDAKHSDKDVSVKIGRPRAMIKAKACDVGVKYAAGGK